MTCKCKDCTDRYVGCHSTCESYKQYQEENEKARKAVREANQTMSLNSNGTMYSGKGGAGNMRHKINGR